MTSAAANAAGQKGDVSDKNVAQDSGGVNAIFSMWQPVEETEALIAMHNLTAEKLEKAIELGGFPMSSIAVTKVDRRNDVWTTFIQD